MPYPKCCREPHIERVLANLGMGGQLQFITSPLETAPPNSIISGTNCITVFSRPNAVYAYALCQLLREILYSWIIYEEPLVP